MFASPFSGDDDNVLTLYSNELDRLILILLDRIDEMLLLLLLLLLLLCLDNDGEVGFAEKDDVVVGEEEEE